jgi:hypothetical protein
MFVAVNYKFHEIFFSFVIYAVVIIVFTQIIHADLLEV